MKNTLWMIRDEDGRLYLFNNKPIIWNFEGSPVFVPNRYKGTPLNHEDIPYLIMKIDSKLFPEVTFENSPQQVKLTLVNNDEK